MGNPEEELSGQARQPGAGSMRALVSGRVQGVGFRFFVIRKARALGLAGEVRNLADGRVEVLAAGSRPALEELEEALRQGPSLSRVDRVQTEWDVPVSQINEFEIGF
jgi:acylphosphatase